MRERFPQLFFGLVLVAAGFVMGSNALAGGIRDRGRDDSIVVTGSARKTIVSDTVVWRASVSSTQPTPADASRQLTGWVDRVRSFLREAGASDEEVRVDPVVTETISETTAEGRDTGKVAGTGCIVRSRSARPASRRSPL